MSNKLLRIDAPEKVRAYQMTEYEFYCEQKNLYGWITQLTCRVCARSAEEGKRRLEGMGNINVNLIREVGPVRPSLHAEQKVERWTPSAVGSVAKAAKGKTYSPPDPI